MDDLNNTVFYKTDMIVMSKEHFDYYLVSDSGFIWLEKYKKNENSLVAKPIGRMKLYEDSEVEY